MPHDFVMTRKVASKDSKQAQIRYLSYEQIVDLNKAVLERFKVSKHDRHLVWYPQKLGKIVEDVKSSEGDIYSKAALLLTELTNNHVFKSGNKRTAFSTTVTFLETNGKNVPVSESPKVMQGIREGFYTQEEMEKWLRHGQIREFSRSP